MIPIRKYYYGDYGDKEQAAGPEPAAGEPQQLPPTPMPGPENSTGDWPLWEVFIRRKQGLANKHAGSLHAADARMAIENARDVYTRRQEGISIWVVASIHIHASNPD